ncbi:hypothetical protein Tsubulata_040277 [Turnera subulata]|uniref:Pentacotripeptide-repeat region of PRORP domain-containing protein n=1 Tax=Turnera subulata TaxID=218843 RepID=A0A9Q0FZB2_9ROSI|nr:hypothetical protein Tsubulata_040277 [Turnera subulata]
MLFSASTSASTCCCTIPSLNTFRFQQQPSTPNSNKTTTRKGYSNNQTAFCLAPNATVSASTTTRHRSYQYSEWPATSRVPPPPPHFTDPVLLASLLQSCNSSTDLKTLHAVVLKCFFAESVTYVFNNLICAYLRHGKLEEARKVFDGMPQRNVVTWTAMIDGYSKFGLEDEAVRLVGECAVEDGVVMNAKTFVCVLNLCSKRVDLGLGRQIHARILKGNWRNVIVDSAVLHFYCECGDLDAVFCLFDRMLERDVVCWSTMIMACSQHGRGDLACELFLQMLHQGVLPNRFTACGVLKACGEEKALGLGRQLHGSVVKKICRNDVFVGTCLVDMYGKCGEIIDARRVFDGMRKRNTVTWSSIIAGYARNGLGEEAIILFRIMKQRRIVSNDMTIVSILRSCGSIQALLTGREIHALTVKNSMQSNEFVGTTLMWFYCKCGESRTASKVLRQMPLRDVVSWTTIISGHAFLGHEFEALEFLKEMMEEGVEPNSYTYSSVLKACGNVKDIQQGKLIHSFAKKNPASINVVVGSALIYMYGRCGNVSEAIQVFDSMPERSLVTWNSMIIGCVKNGLYQEALKFMYQMRGEGIEVDDFVFSTVINTCGDVSRAS